MPDSPAASETKTTEDSLSFKQKGNDAMQRDDVPAAIDFYTKAIELDPSNHILFSNRCAGLMKQKEYQKALLDAEKCTSLNPTWAKGFLRLAHVLLELDRLEEAEEAMETGAALDNVDLEGSFSNIAHTIKAKKVTRFFNKIKGPWHGTVSRELGGYDQEIEFITEKTAEVTIMGRKVLARMKLTLHDPFFLDLTVDFDEPTRVQTGLASETVLYIIKVSEDGNTATLASSEPSAQNQRPTSFEGITKVVMRKGNLPSQAVDSSLTFEEKITGYVREVLEIFPVDQRLMPLQTDTEDERKRISLLNVKFQADNFKITKKYGDAAEEKIREYLVGLATPEANLANLISTLKDRMQQALLLPADSEIGAFQERQKDYQNVMQAKPETAKAEKKESEVSKVVPTSADKVNSDSTEKALLIASVGFGVLAVGLALTMLLRRGD